MRTLKKICLLTIVLGSFVHPATFLGADPFANLALGDVLSKLQAQEYSEKDVKIIDDLVRDFITHQKFLEGNFKEVLKDKRSATIVKGFKVGDSNMALIKEKLAPFTSSPVFYRAPDLDAEPVPYVSSLKAFRAIGFTMNRAAEAALSGRFVSNGDNGSEQVFDHAQIEVAIDQVCLHLQYGYGDFKLLLNMLVQKKNNFSPGIWDEIIRVVLGADYLECRKTLNEAIQRDARDLGIHDLSVITNFDMDLITYDRYCEMRVDRALLQSGDRARIQAFRNFYMNRNDSSILRLAVVLKRRAILQLLEEGRPLPVEHLELEYPEDRERVEACDKALEELANRKLLERDFLRCKQFKIISQPVDPTDVVFLLAGQVE